MSMTTTAWILLLSVLLSHGALADTHYVSLSGGHTHPFTNWPAAATNIQAAVDASHAGDTVQVAYGTYDKGGRAAAGSRVKNRVLVDKPIALVGMAVAGSGMPGPIIVGRQPGGAASNEVVRCIWLTNGASILRFQIAYGCVGDDQDGGGIFCEGRDAVVDACSIVFCESGSGGGVNGGMLKNSVVMRNKAIFGGGVNNGWVTNCQITLNEAWETGGGINQSVCWNTIIVSNSAAWRSGGGNGKFYSCDFIGNTAEWAGGGGEGEFYACNLMGNSSGEVGGGAMASSLYKCALIGNRAVVRGGGAFDSTLRDCRLEQNSAGIHGGGLFGGEIYSSSLVGNHAGVGGGGVVFCWLNDCRLEGNEAEVSGGGASRSTLIRCTVVSNAALVGGGLEESMATSSLIQGNRASIDGGGTTGCVLRACTVVGNSAAGSGGGTIGGTQENSIVYDNTATTHANWLDEEFRYSCTLPLPPGPGNITNLPGFVNAQRGDYRLRYGSPCIDAGMDLATVTNDLLGVRRPLDGDWDGQARQDMGAYEYDAGRMDSDGDGMRDGWERRYGLKPLEADGTVDADKDGIVNRDEFAADTDPGNADSFFKLLSVTGFPVRVDFEPSSTGRWYTLQWRKGLTGSAWSNVAGQVEVSGAGNLQALQDASVSPQRFYRVGVRVK